MTKIFLSLALFLSLSAHAIPDAVVDAYHKLFEDNAKKIMDSHAKDNGQARHHIVQQLEVLNQSPGANNELRALWMNAAFIILFHDREGEKNQGAKAPQKGAP
jgi:hypothetical protein